VDSFAGKLALVTGGGSGMGHELARQLLGEGASADELRQMLAVAGRCSRLAARG
jgi:NAD(P)-dependent dehydrogenase (short-subunit alcohol dehydrogenase family)